MPIPIRDVAVLLSGGIDSTVCAEIARRAGRLACVFTIDYGQPARVQELIAAHDWAERANVEYWELRLTLGDLEAMDCGIGVEGPRVIPGRNLAFLTAVACNCATIGFREIWYGAIADDQAEYEDCRAEFIDGLNETFRIAMSFPVKVVAPLIGLTKQQVIQRAVDMGIDLRKTWSCYAPMDDGCPCRGCNSCRSRSVALVEGGDDE